MWATGELHRAAPSPPCGGLGRAQELAADAATAHARVHDERGDASAAAWLVKRRRDVHAHHADDLVAAHLGLIDVDLDLAAGLGGARFQRASPDFVPVHRLLADALRDPAFGDYDEILIDCAPNFNMVTRTAIVASDHVLIPARPDYLSTLGIDYLRTRLSALVDTYNTVAGDEINPEIVGVVYNMIQHAATGPIKAQQASMERLTQIEIPIFRQTIRENKTAFTDAGDRSVPVVLAREGTAAVVTLQYELQQFVSEFLAKTRI